MKLKKSLLGLLLFFSLVPLCVFGVFSIQNTNHKIDTLLQGNLKAISETQITNIQKFANDRKLAMEKISEYELVLDAIKNSLGEADKKIDREYLDNILKQQKKHGSYVASVSILDKNFHVVSSSEQYVVGEESQLKKVDPKFHTGEFIIGNVYEREIDGELRKVVPAYVGVFDDGELAGYVSEELDTAYFNDLRLNMDTLSKGTFYLLDGEYTIITAGDNSSQNSLQSFVTKKDQRSEYQEKWAAIDFEKNPAGELTYHYNNEEYITYYSNVEDTEWSIRITENLTAQKQSKKSYTLLLALMLLVLVTGIIMVQTFMTHKILNPIQQAIQIFHTIEEKQDYSLRMPRQSKNEMDELMEGINELLRYIEQEKIHELMTQNELRVQAESDPLTGVKNKKAIEKYILDMVELSAQTGVQITVGFLDIDDFRSFNTNYGHQLADKVICYVAQTLRENIKGEVGRVGGDEFVFCCMGTLEEDKMKEDAHKILKILRESYHNPDTQEHICVTCSLGMVTAKGHHMDYTSFIRAADQAMYQAKREGKNTVVLEKI